MMVIKLNIWPGPTPRPSFAQENRLRIKHDVVSSSEVFDNGTDGIVNFSFNKLGHSYVGPYLKCGAISSNEINLPLKCKCYEFTSQCRTNLNFNSEITRTFCA